MPYDAAKDLPAYQELWRLVQGAKRVTLVFARQEREKILEIEREIDRLVRVVDDFYAPLPLPEGTAFLRVDTGSRKQGPSETLLCDFQGNCP